MNIGQRIKALRSSKMMTQSELAGTEITRNMLSRIENGNALPSLPTLIYLAEKLGVPAGFLLADDNDDTFYKKNSILPDIRKAYAAGDWSICRDLCESINDADDELNYLIAMCDFNSGVDAFSDGNLRLAKTLFESVCSVDDYPEYPVTETKLKSSVYLAYMREISPSFDSDEAAANVPDSTLSDPFCRYCSVFIGINSGNEEKTVIDTAKYASLTDNDNIFYSGHINARLMIKAGNYAGAHACLKKLLNDSVALPSPMLYFIFSDLELCCGKLSDFKGAYEYSGDKMGMMERFFR